METGTGTFLLYHTESGMPISFGTEHSAGLDLPYYDPDAESITLQPGDRALLPTGISCEIPEGYFGLLDSRSSTSKKKLDLLCRIIDADYRGVIHLSVINHNDTPVTIERGDYMFQMVITPYLKVHPAKVMDKSLLSATERGSKGFGSTGNKKGVTDHE